MSGDQGEAGRNAGFVDSYWLLDVNEGECEEDVVMPEPELERNVSRSTR